MSTTTESVADADADPVKSGPGADSPSGGRDHRKQRPVAVQHMAGWLFSTPSWCSSPSSWLCRSSRRSS